MNEKKLEEAISNSLENFHRSRLQDAQKLKLKTLLRRKNPYLYKALGYENAADFMSSLLESHLKESDETIFGNSSTMSGGR